MDTVLVVAHRRPEMLALCLERLGEAHAGYHPSRGCTTYVLLDRGYDPECEEVARMHGGEGSIIRRDHRTAGNNYNVLEGFREVVEREKAGATVHLIEEDVMVARDYFHFADMAHRAFPTTAFCVTACESLTLQNRGARTRHDPKAVFFSPRYQSLAMSFSVENLREHVLPHARQEYYDNPRQYMAEHFSTSKIGHGMGEQDCLIDNVMHDRGLKCIVPCSPRAFHAGWYGGTRSAWRPEGSTWRERYAQVRAILANPERLQSVAGKYAHDCRPCPLEGYFAEELTWTKDITERKR